MNKVSLPCMFKTTRCIFFPHHMYMHLLVSSFTRSSDRKVVVGTSSTWQAAPWWAFLPPSLCNSLITIEISTNARVIQEKNITLVVRELRRGKEKERVAHLATAWHHSAFSERSSLILVRFPPCATYSAGSRSGATCPCEGGVGGHSISTQRQVGRVRSLLAHSQPL